MVDVLTPAQRHRCMSAIRGKNTKPELVVRRMIHRLGYRFRLHRKDLPGKPDIVLPRHRKIIDVRGCYWHMHTCKYGRVTPKTNAEFWQEKRMATKKRDLKNLRLLHQMGWDVLIVWECELREPDGLAERLSGFLEDSGVGCLV